MEETLVFCIKISQKKWIEILQNGMAWFSVVNRFITQAEKTNNNEQGDKYEGVFARCKKNSTVIDQYQMKFGDDLEVIDDGDFCFLRRKTSRQACVFCMYGVKDVDLSLINIIDKGDGSYLGKFRYDINPKMYNGFLQDGKLPSEVAGYYCSSGHIIKAIESSLNKSGYKWIRKMIQYDIDITREFFIEPEANYPELFHKRCDLEYQHEVRFIVLGAQCDGDGVAVPFQPLSENSGNIALGELYFEGVARLQKEE